jgi:hypothetical protein
MINPKLLLVTVDCCWCVIQCIDYQSNVVGFLLFVADSIDHQSNVVSGYLLLILLMINPLLLMVVVEHCWFY